MNILVKIKMNGYFVMGFLVIQTAFLLILYSRWSIHYPDIDGKDRVHLLILSSWRSGSSFVGQIFSQHPDVFYLMEPAWHVWVTKFQNSAKVLQIPVMDVIRSVFLCDMSVFDSYMLKERNVSSLFQWAVSRALCTVPACKSFPRNEITDELACKSTCGNYPFNNIEQICNTYSHVVIKEVRLFELEALYPLLTDPSLNVKILHLVRDPRAVANSREQLKIELTIDNGIVLNTNGTKVQDSKFKVMQEICQSHTQMYEMAAFKAPSFLKNRYMLVRYEDVVRDPVREISEMFKYVELELTHKLEKWIYNITHGQSLGDKDKFTITSRNALNVSQAWRNIFPFDKVKRIQNICEGAMNVFRYQFVNSEEEQKDLNVEVVMPRRQD